jgi:hypothetical protein
MLNRIVGAIGVLWGALMLLSAVIQIGAEDGVGVPEVATLLFALALLAFGGYCLVLGGKAFR